METGSCTAAITALVDFSGPPPLYCKLQIMENRVLPGIGIRSLLISARQARYDRICLLADSIVKLSTSVAVAMIVASKDSVYETQHHLPQVFLQMKETA